jgi:SAM-dependent methyltransferase
VSDSDCPRHPDAGYRSLLVATDSVTSEQFEVVECAECGLTRTNPRPPPELLDLYYASGYHGAAKRYKFGLDQTLSAVHRARIRRLERLAGAPGRVLDIGCGPGRFLDQMRSRGWETVGTERTDAAARQARDVFGLDVRVQDLDAFIAEGATFDAVVLWHVAEHIHDPAMTFVDIARLLRPGGVAMVGVPNFGSPEARIGGSGWFHLDVPRHLFHFTPTTLNGLLTQAGLEPRKVVYVAPEYDIFSFVQTAENRLGLPLNLLYDVVRRREARLAHPTLGSAVATAAVVAAVPFAALGLAWMPVAAVLQLSSTITVYAQRPLSAT